MAFSGSFWSILNFSHQSSHIDDLLNNPETTLENLLEDDSILSEFKSLNPRLLEYHTDDKVKQLLSYLVEEPPEDADRNRGYKFPYVSCEILTADVQTLLSAFFGKNPNNIKPKHHQVQESSGEYEEYQNSGAEQPEEETTEKKETAEEPQEEPEQEKEEKEEPQEATEEKEEVTEEKEEKTEEPEKETEDKEGAEEPEKVETEENKEETQKEEDAPVQRTERFSITVRSPRKEEPSEKSEEEEEAVSMELAHYFFSFLSRETLNVTLVGYFSRFLKHLMERRGTETAEFIWSNPHIVDNFIKHVEYGSLAECLAKLFILEGLSSSISNDFLEIRLEKLNRLVEIFNAEASDINSDAIANTCFIIGEIITKRNIAYKGHDFQVYLFSKEFLDIFFNNLLRHVTLTTHLSTILNSLLQVALQKSTGKKVITETSEDEADNEGASPKAEDFDESVFYEHLTAKIGDIVEYLEAERDAQVNTTYGTTLKPFGVGKLRLVEAIFYMVKLNVHKISFELGLKKVFQVLMDLMLIYEWNNMLHNNIERIFTSTLESDSHVLKQKLLNQADLVGFLNRSTREVGYRMPNPKHRSMRKGYLGHLTRIGKVLEKLAERDDDIKEYLNNENWTEFCESYLKPSIKDENHDLAGFTKKHSEDFSEENIHIGNNIDDALGGKFDAFYGFDQVGNNNFHTDDVFDNFNNYEKELEAWKETEGSNVASAGSWSTGFDDKGFTFDFEGSSKQSEDEEDPDNNYLKLNKQVKIIEIGRIAEEFEFEQEYIENQYWAKPLSTSHDIDDILKEFEQTS